MSDSPTLNFSIGFLVSVAASIMNAAASQMIGSNSKNEFNLADLVSAVWHTRK
jgi:hypothetical protein